VPSPFWSSSSTTCGNGPARFPSFPNSTARP
jgi:hypothetical protein